MGPYPARMKRTTSRKLSKPLPDPWDPKKIEKINIFSENFKNPKIPFRENIGFPNWALGFVPIFFSSWTFPGFPLSYVR